MSTETVSRRFRSSGLIGEAAKKKTSKSAETVAEADAPTANLNKVWDSWIHVKRIRYRAQTQSS